MNLVSSQNSIGVFDSGIGGLTVVKAVKELLPNEKIIYFGDTAHLPYGDKSTSAIQKYVLKICEELLSKQCKAILIACNSASSAFELLTNKFDMSVKIFDVIQPTISFLSTLPSLKKIGLIGTKQTVEVNAYGKKIDALNLNVEFSALATPMLVPMIEEGFYKNQISQTIIDKYLHNKKLESIDALILGCTHYPIIKEQIAKRYGKQHPVIVIDSALQVAQELKEWLDINQLHQTLKNQEDEFYVSDYTHSFEKTAQLFFGEKVKLQEWCFW